MATYDYIIIGAGAAGLMLADAMGKDAFFKDKSILLLDKDAKQTNDRTWCFWEKDQGQFDTLVHRSWNHIFFAGKHFSKRFNIVPYTYKMIRGIDFYSAYLERIATYTNLSFKQESVIKVNAMAEGVSVLTNKADYSAKQVFNSIFDYKMATHQKKYPVLQQHFIGWFVKTEKPVFDGNQATFMDFSVPQKGNTRFMYVLPFSETEALVEYTLFSENLLPEAVYENAITEYLEVKLNGNAFEILQKEKGSIPMTCYDFQEHNSANVLCIGTAGGWAKPSTGYTFRNTSKKTKALIHHIKAEKPLSSFSQKTKFWFYDLLLLDILHKDNSKGCIIFEALFKNRNPQLIFKFLDEETSFLEDLKIIFACPKKLFIKAFFNRLI